MWAVFAPGAVAWRLPWAMLLGMSMWCVLTISNRLAYHFSRSEALLLGGVLLGGILVAQIPLWILRLFLQFRFYPPGERSASEEQFNMRQMLSGIALCCVALAVVQGVLPRGESAFGGPPDRELLVILAIVAPVNLLLTLPCMWIALTSRAQFLAFWGSLFAGYVLVITIVETTVLSFFLGSFQLREYFGLGFFNLMQGVSIAVTLSVLRGSGFSWERRVAYAAAPAVLEKPMAAASESGPAVHPLDLP
jgi:hypothetical protein